MSRCQCLSHPGSGAPAHISPKEHTHTHAQAHPHAPDVQAQWSSAHTPPSLTHTAIFVVTRHPPTQPHLTPYTHSRTLPQSWQLSSLSPQVSTNTHSPSPSHRRQVADNHRAASELGVGVSDPWTQNRLKKPLRFCCCAGGCHCEYACGAGSCATAAPVSRPLSKLVATTVTAISSP